MIIMTNNDNNTSQAEPLTDVRVGEWGGWHLRGPWPLLQHPWQGQQFGCAEGVLTAVMELLEVDQKQVIQGLIGLIHCIVTVEGDTLHQAAQEVCGGTELRVDMVLRGRFMKGDEYSATHCGP